MSNLRQMTSHNNLHALLFQATSAEYVALCIQMYQLARHALLSRLNQRTFCNPAVVLDLDETILDNSPYQAWLISSGTNFHEQTSWRKWCDLGMARAVPGAVEFVTFAAHMGVTPIFITSRENVTRIGTARNLAALGLMSQEELSQEECAAWVDDSATRTRLFMKGMGNVEFPRPDKPQIYSLGNKFEQRVFCEQVRRHEVVLSIGDNLADYAEDYGRVLTASGKKVDGQHPTTEARCASTLQDKQLFGRDFILMPNATYGGWLRAFEANGLGAGDELASTAEQVREGLVEPQEPFSYENDTKTAIPKGPKFGPDVPQWDGGDSVLRIP